MQLKWRACLAHAAQNMFWVVHAAEGATEEKKEEEESAKKRAKLSPPEEARRPQHIRFDRCAFGCVCVCAL